MRREAVAVALGFLGAACSPTHERGADRDTVPVAAAAVVPTSPPDSVTAAAAMATLAAFLDASREGSTTSAELGRLTRCSGTPDDRLAGPMLAAYELLSPLARGDTVVGRAVVTTVAEQDVDRRHPGYFIARVRVRADTLEWDIIRSPDGAWVVCNGLAFGLTAPDSLTTWRPDGASRASARTLADSIAAARTSNPQSPKGARP